MTEQSQGKGRPTPKRSEAQKRRGGPVAPPPSNRREAARQLREKQAANRQAVRRANVTGDDSLLLPRDQGPVRRAVRDVVDSRFNLGWLLLPVAGVVLIGNFARNDELKAITLGIWLATIVGVAFDLALAGMQIRSAVRTQFPGEKTGGHIRYGLLRTTVMRRLRMPKPQVPRGRNR